MDGGFAIVLLDGTVLAPASMVDDDRWLHGPSGETFEDAVVEDRVPLDDPAWALARAAIGALVDAGAIDPASCDGIALDGAVYAVYRTIAGR